MKKTVSIFAFALFSFFVFASNAEAHPGRTAGDGCHYCRTNCESWGEMEGARHCHGGGSVSSDSTSTSTTTNNIVVPTTPPYKETDMDKKKLFKVVNVIDGDTIDVSMRGRVERVRLLGIDTPETKDPRKPVQCFGLEATKKMQSFVNDKYVKLVDDRSQGNRDKYKRLLRYVYLDDSKKTFVNGEMVAQGYAFSYKKYPTKHLEEFDKFERQAREKNLGLWGKCQ